MKYLETLSIRAQLTEVESKRLNRLQKGFEGEQLYDIIFEEAGHDGINIFRDIWIKADKSLVQIDSLIVSDDKVIINEIKNYSGQYTYENNVWHVGNIQISDDPIIQVKRASSKLIKIFRENHINIVVDSKVIFPNPYFIISTNDDACTASVIKRDRIKIYMRTLNRLTSRKDAREIIQLIESYRVPEPFYQISTDFSRLKTGRYCMHCNAYELDSHRGFTVCRNCHGRTSNKLHVLNAVQDFQILYHNEQVTTAVIQKILKNEISRSTVQRNLRTYCTPVNHGRSRAYELQRKDRID
ncbi:nuclease-related domain-containing protein [Salinicoccus sp. Marseille-QA3877]